MKRSGTLAALAAALVVTACGPGGAGLPGNHQVSAHALRQAATDPEVRAFYEARHWKAAWSEAAARDLLKTIDESDKHGIDADRFLAYVGQAPDLAHEETGLTLAALAYAKAMSMGLADPKKLYGIYTLKSSKVDVVEGLNQALAQGIVSQWLEGLAPQDPEYQAMSATYLSLRKLIAENKAAPIAEGSTIKPGRGDTRIPAIAAAMHNAGFLPGPFDPQATLYGPAMVAGIKGLQTEAGLKADGTIGNATITALNSVLSDHAQQLALNLERRRWLARDLAATRIDVNTASALLDYYSGGTVAYSARVVVGKPDAPTPQLSARLFQLVANPPWNVPDGIARKEIFTKGPGYLESEDMYVDNGHVIQRPGPKAALGEVKFDLDDPYAIYLHDTPSKGPFATPYRHKSHGCVRVQGAVGFARMLAQQQGVLDDFDSKLASKETGVVTLKNKIPVRLFYHTVFVDGSGTLVYLPDPYGWDEKLAASLGMKAPRRLRIDDGTTIPLGP